MIGGEGLVTMAVPMTRRWGRFTGGEGRVGVISSLVVNESALNCCVAPGRQRTRVCEPVRVSFVPALPLRLVCLPASLLCGVLAHTASCVPTGFHPVRVSRSHFFRVGYHAVCWEEYFWRFQRGACVAFGEVLSGCLWRYPLRVGRNRNLFGEGEFARCLGEGSFRFRNLLGGRIQRF